MHVGAARVVYLVTVVECISVVNRYLAICFHWEHTHGATSSNVLTSILLVASMYNTTEHCLHGKPTYVGEIDH